jgi:hypothetical protein
MAATYIAFGLRLRSEFPLPGMRPRQAAGLPTLAIEAVQEDRLEASWSGGAEGRAWRGRLGDGTELTIERGRAGDLRVANGERAAFHLDRRGSRLQCAPRDPGELGWKRLLASRVLSLASLSHGNQALHASAVQAPQGVVAIAGSAAAGKSTLAAELTARGWPHFTDDVLVLAAGPDGPLAHPGTPHATLTTGGPGVDPRLLGETLDVQGEESWIAVSASALGPRALAAVVLLDRRPGLEPEVVTLLASPLTLAPQMLGLPDEGEAAEARRFALDADLAESASFLSLRADERARPEELADLVERALEPEPATAGMGVS